MARIVTTIVLLMLAANAYANGGGPLLLIFNFMAFAFGSIVIIAVEAFTYRALAKLELSQAIKDAFWVNLWSTLIIGFGFPFLISSLAGIVGEIYEPAADYALAVGTWIFDGIKHPKLTIAFVYLWLVVAYFLTVFLESVVLSKRWRKRKQNSPVTAERINWIGNTITYLLLILSFTLGFGVELWPKS